MRPQVELAASLVLLLGLVSSRADSGPGLSPVNITTTLVNAGKFNTLVDLLQSSGLEVALMQKETSSGITLFAPTDDAFASLPSGELTSLTQPQIISLLEYHVLPSYFTLTALEAISGPSVLTLASDKTGKPSLSISTSSDTVTLSTGVDSAQVLTTLIDQYPLVAVYVIDAVLLPSDIFPAAPGLSPLGTPGIPPVEAPGISPSLEAPGISPSSEAPGISPSSEAPALSSAPNLPPLLGPEIAPQPAYRTPAPFFRPFGPPGTGNLGNGPEAAPGAPSLSNGVTILQAGSNFVVVTSMAFVLLSSIF